MNYPIPDNPQDILALQQNRNRINEELVAAAIAGVVKIVRAQGQSLEELTAEVLADDPILNKQQRRLLSQLVAQAWDSFS